MSKPSKPSKSSRAKAGGLSEEVKDKIRALMEESTKTGKIIKAVQEDDENITADDVKAFIKEQKLADEGGSMLQDDPETANVRKELVKTRRGKAIPWEEEERDMLYELVLERPEGLEELEKIRDELNAKFKHDRTTNALKAKLRVYAGKLFKEGKSVKEIKKATKIPDLDEEKLKRINRRKAAVKRTVTKVGPEMALLMDRVAMLEKQVNELMNGGGGGRAAAAPAKRR